VRKRNVHATVFRTYSGGLDEQRRWTAPKQGHVVKSSTNLARALSPQTVRGLLCRSGAKCIGRQGLTASAGPFINRMETRRRLLLLVEKTTWAFGLAGLVGWGAFHIGAATSTRHYLGDMR
jgi:hypothetical protein